MAIVLTKTDYLLWRECKKNAWLKIHRRDIWDVQELSDFEKQIIETGNEVDEVSRQLFPGGFLIEGRGLGSQEKTHQLLLQKTKVIFQPEFLQENFRAACDILELNDDGSYNIYEVKSTTDIDAKTHFHDVAFQVILLELCGLKIKKAYVIHLNSEYIRQGELNINQLFRTEDITEHVHDIKDAVADEMKAALGYMQQEEEPKGYCDCVYKGRSNHCATFHYSNPKVPEYGVHDISRIGANKAKLQELIDVGIFELKDISEQTLNKLSLPQKNQIEAFVHNTVLRDATNIKRELDSLTFPLYFLDYETFPCAIPRFDGFSPYQQMPFQYSLYILYAPKSEPKHFEFLFSENQDPSKDFLTSLQNNITNTGTIIVWNKKFECGINEQLAQRNPSYKVFITELNARVYDLMDIFGKQFYVHKDFKGKISIKNVLPVLVPELSYKNLEIQEGGTASQKWNEMHEKNIRLADKEKIIKNLKEYCKLDTYAMYAIWKHLYELVN